MSERPDVTPRAWLLPASSHALILVAMVVRLIVFGPRIHRDYAEFSLALPWLTQFVFRVSMWLAAYWYVMIPVLLAVLVVNTVVLWRLGGLRRRAGWLWTWIGGGALFALWAVAELGFLLPIWNMKEGPER